MGGTGSRLPSTIFDGDRMHRILHTTYGFRDIRVMHDDLNQGHTMYPTVQKVKAQIIAIVAEARRLHDLGRRCSLFIYYSGHGGTGPSSAESTNDKECLDLRCGQLWDTELNEILADQIPYLTTAFVMADACHSGTLLDLRYRYDSDPRGRVWKRRSRISAERRGRTEKFAKEHTPNDPTSPGRLYYLSGCGDGEKSVELSYTNWRGEIKSISGGALTLSFEELLENPRGQNFTIEKMVIWIIGNVQNAKGCSQTPLLSRNFRSNRCTSFADAINGRDHTPQGGDYRNPHGVRGRLNERPPHGVMGVPVKLHRGNGPRNQGS